eukprot:2206426-Pyramimonas_sp.AAC.1
MARGRVKGADLETIGTLRGCLPGKQTINRGELYAVIQAIQNLAGELTIVTDSAQDPSGDIVATSTCSKISGRPTRASTGPWGFTKPSLILRRRIPGTMISRPGPTWPTSLPTR